MNIRVACPGCGRASTISAEFAGRELTCPECQQRFETDAAPSGRLVLDGLSGASVAAYWCVVVFMGAVVVLGISGALNTPEPPKFQQLTPSIRPHTVAPAARPQDDNDARLISAARGAQKPARPDAVRGTSASEGAR